MLELQQPIDALAIDAMADGEVAPREAADAEGDPSAGRGRARGREKVDGPTQDVGPEPVVLIVPHNRPPIIRNYPPTLPTASPGSPPGRQSARRWRDT